MGGVKPLVAVKNVAEPFRESVRSVCAQLLERFPKTLALVIIGSVAEGGWDEQSDVDIVWVTGKLPKNWRERMPHVERVFFIPFSRKVVEYHFERATTMAHALQRGLTLYDPKGYAARLKRRRLGSPDPQWMKEWFQHWQRFYKMGLSELRRTRRFHRKQQHEQSEKECRCIVNDPLARAAVNFAILWVETYGVVPTCKRDLRQHFNHLTKSERVRQAMAVALTVHHEDRWMSLAEAEQTKLAAQWLRRQLAQRLRKL